MRTRARIELLRPRPSKVVVGDQVQMGYPAEILRWDLGSFHALRSFDQDKVLKANRLLKHAAKQLRLYKKVVLPENSRDQFSKPAIPGDSSLRTMKLVDCQMNCWHQGFFLTGSLRDQAFNFGGLAVTALQDDSGTCTRLLIRNKIDWGTSAEDVERLYPQRARVVVQEPCLVREAVGIKGNTLWVSNPATLKVVSYYPHITATKGFENPNLLKELGDKDFLSQNFAAAVELYTKCVELCEGRKEEVLVLALCCRAEAYLKLGCPFKALQDTERVLALDSRQTQCYWTKGRALLELRQYTLGSDCLKQAANISPDNYGVQQAYKESISLTQQSHQGKLPFNLFLEMSSSGFKGKSLADHLGPVTVKMTDDGRGRGVFATSKISKGEVVMVMNAAVASPTPVHSSEFLTLVLSASVNCPRVRAQVHALHDEKVVPSMELLRPNWSEFDHEKAEQEIQVDVAGVERVVAAAACRHCQKVTGLWTLPSLINHSCLPNVSIKTSGKVAYVSASKDIGPGTELLAEYDSVLLPWIVRTKNLSKFRCQCVRCEFEQQLRVRLHYIDDKFEAESQDLKASRQHTHEDASLLNPVTPSLNPALVELAVRVEEKVQRLGLAEEHKQWLRASYAEAYVHYYINKAQGGSVSKLYTASAFCEDNTKGPKLRLPKMEDFLLALHETAPGSDNTYRTMLVCSRVGAVCGTVARIMQESYGHGQR